MLNYAVCCFYWILFWHFMCVWFSCWASTFTFVSTFEAYWINFYCYSVLFKYIIDLMFVTGYFVSEKIRNKLKEEIKVCAKASIFIFSPFFHFFRHFFIFSANLSITSSGQQNTLQNVCLLIPCPP